MNQMDIYDCVRSTTNVYTQASSYKDHQDDKLNRASVILKSELSGYVNIYYFVKLVKVLTCCHFVFKIRSTYRMLPI